MPIYRHKSFNSLEDKFRLDRPDHARLKCNIDCLRSRHITLKVKPPDFLEDYVHG